LSYISNLLDLLVIHS